MREIKETKLHDIVAKVAAVDLDARDKPWKAPAGEELRANIVAEVGKLPDEVRLEYVLDALPHYRDSTVYYTEAALKKWDQLVTMPGPLMLKESKESKKADATINAVAEGVKTKFVYQQIAKGWSRPPKVKTDAEHDANVQWLHTKLKAMAGICQNLAVDASPAKRSVHLKKLLLQLHQLGTFLTNLYPGTAGDEIAKNFAEVARFFQPSYQAGNTDEPESAEEIVYVLFALEQALRPYQADGRLNIRMVPGLSLCTKFFKLYYEYDAAALPDFNSESAAIEQMMDLFNTKETARVLQTYQDIIDRIARDATTLDVPQARVNGKMLADELQGILDDRYSGSKVNVGDALNDLGYKFTKNIKKAEEALPKPEGENAVPFTEWSNIFKRAMVLLSKNDKKEGKREEKEKKPQISDPAQQLFEKAERELKEASKSSSPKESKERAIGASHASEINNLKTRDQQILAIFPEPPGKKLEHALHISRLIKLIEQAEKYRAHVESGNNLSLLILTYDQLGELLSKFCRDIPGGEQAEKFKQLRHCFRGMKDEVLNVRNNEVTLRAVMDIRDAIYHGLGTHSSDDNIAFGFTVCEEIFFSANLEGQPSLRMGSIGYSERCISIIGLTTQWTEHVAELRVAFQAAIDQIGLSVEHLAISSGRVKSAKKLKQIGTQVVSKLQTLLDGYSIGEINFESFYSQFRQEISNAEAALYTHRGVFTHWSDIFEDEMDAVQLELPQEIFVAETASLSLTDASDSKRSSSSLSLSSTPPSPSSVSAATASTIVIAPVPTEQPLAVAAAMQPPPAASVSPEPSSPTNTSILKHPLLQGFISGGWFFIFTLLLAFMILKTALGSAMVLGWWIYAPLTILSCAGVLFLLYLWKNEADFYSEEEKFTFKVKWVGVLGMISFLLAISFSPDAIFSPTVMLPCIAATTVLVSFFFGKQAQKDDIETLWQWLARTEKGQSIGTVENLWRKVEQESNTPKDSRDMCIEDVEMLMHVLEIAIKAFHEADDRFYRKQGKLEWGPRNKKDDIANLEKVLARVRKSRDSGKSIIGDDVSRGDIRHTVAILQHFKTCEISGRPDNRYRYQIGILIAAFVLAGTVVLGGLALFNVDNAASIFSSSSVVAVGWVVGLVGTLAFSAIKIIMERNRRLPLNYNDFVERSADERLPLESKIIGVIAAVLVVLNIWVVASFGFHSISSLSMLLVTVGWGIGWFALELRSHYRKESAISNRFVMVDAELSEDRGEIKAAREKKESKEMAEARAELSPPRRGSIADEKAAMKNNFIAADAEFSDDEEEMKAEKEEKEWMLRGHRPRPDFSRKGSVANEEAAAPAKHRRIVSFHQLTPAKENNITAGKTESVLASRFFTIESCITLSGAANVAAGVMQTYFVTAAILAGTQNYGALSNPGYNFVWNFVEVVGNSIKNGSNTYNRMYKKSIRDKNAHIGRRNFYQRCWDFLNSGAFYEGLAKYDGDNWEKALSTVEWFVAVFLLATNFISLDAQLKGDKGLSSALSSYGFALSMLVCTLRALKTTVTAYRESKPAGLLKSKLERLKSRLNYLTVSEQTQLVNEILALARVEKDAIEAEERLLVSEIIEQYLPRDGEIGTYRLELLEKLSENPHPTEEGKLLVQTLLTTNRKKFEDAVTDFVGYLFATVCFWYLAVGRQIGTSFLTDGGIANTFLVMGGVIKLGQVIKFIYRFLRDRRSNLGEKFLADITPAVTEFLMKRPAEAAAFEEFFKEKGIKSANIATETSYIIAYYRCRVQILQEEERNSAINSEKDRIQKFLKELHADPEKKGLLKIATEEFAITARCHVQDGKNPIMAALEELAATPRMAASGDLVVNTKANLFKANSGKWGMNAELRGQAAKLLFDQNFFRSGAKAASVTNTVVAATPTIALPPAAATATLLAPLDPASIMGPTIAAPLAR